MDIKQEIRYEEAQEEIQENYKEKMFGPQPKKCECCGHDIDVHEHGKCNVGGCCCQEKDD